MCRNKQTGYYQKQQGGALAIAVFVILVMSLLTVAISRSISASTDQSVQEVLGTRALLAAESANELGLAQLFPVATGTAITNGNCASVNTSLQYFVSVPGLQNCIVSTSCSNRTAGTDEFFLLRSRGVCKSTLLGSSATPNIADQLCQSTDRVCVSRQVEVEAKVLP